MPFEFIDTTPMLPHRRAAEPIPFPDPAAVSDAHERRARRIQAETERVQSLARAAREDGYDSGYQRGYMRGSRFGFYLGAVVALAASFVLVSLGR